MTRRPAAVDVEVDLAVARHPPAAKAATILPITR
jgi:hypothetical protein